MELVQFRHLTIALVINILGIGSLSDLGTADPAYAQTGEEPEYEVVEGSYENTELGFSLVLPDSVEGFVYQYEHDETKGLTMQIHPQFDSGSAPCCPSIDTSPIVFLLTSDTLDRLSSPDPLSGDIYAAFQGYNMRMSIKELGDNQVLVATVYSNNDRVGLDYTKHVGKFYLMNNDERFLSYGIWATEGNYQKYLDEFEESVKSLSIENAKPVDLHSLFSRYAYSDIEVQLTEGSVRPEIVTPSIINSVIIDENSSTISMNVTEPNGNSFLMLNSGDLIKGPHSITLDEEPVESTTLSNEYAEYLMIFYDQPGNHYVTVTGTAIIPEFGSFANVKPEKVIGIDKLSELSGLMLDQGLVLSEISWSGDGKDILFGLSGVGNKSSLWMVDPMNATKIQNIDFPSEQFSNLVGYKLSDEGELLFAGTKESPGVDATGSSLFNLFAFDMNGKTISQVTNYSGPVSVVPFAYDWMPGGKVVYETRSMEYDSARDEYTESWAIWLSPVGDGNNVMMLWNSTKDESGFSSLAASPDGKRLALVDRSGLSVFDVSERILKVIEPNDDIARTNGLAAQGGPKWTANSESIIFWHTQYQQNEGVADSRGNRLYVNETSLRIAFADGSTDEVILRLPSLIPSSELAPASVSPDGKFIAYGIFYVPEINTVDEGGIFLVDLASHAIPEFPYGATLLVSLGILSVAVISRLGRLRKWV